MQFSESSWAFKFPAPPNLKSSQHCYNFQLFILAGGCSSDIQCAVTWYLSSVSLCGLEDETLQLLVSRLHTLTSSCFSHGGHGLNSQLPLLIANKVNHLIHMLSNKGARNYSVSKKQSRWQLLQTN